MKRIMLVFLSLIFVTAVFARPPQNTSKCRQVYNKAMMNLNNKSRSISKQYQRCLRQNRGNKAAMNQCRVNYQNAKNQLSSEKVKIKQDYTNCVNAAKSTATTTSASGKPCQQQAANMSNLLKQYQSMTCKGLKGVALRNCYQTRSSLRSQYYQARKIYYQCLSHARSVR